MKVILKVHEGLNSKPISSSGEKGFVKLSKCKDCGIIGYELDVFYLDPCKQCGGEIDKEIAVGKWNFETLKWEIRTGIEKDEVEFYTKEEKLKSSRKASRKTGSGEILWR